ncbi:hypothetical protein BC936DRAFT_145345, partial [Jimgerdemannia flammicorona]
MAFSDVHYVFLCATSFNFALCLFRFRGERAGVASTERENLSRTLGNEAPMQRKSVREKGDGY